MREILFRGKRICDGGWVEGSLLSYSPHYDWVAIFHIVDDDDGMLEMVRDDVTPSTVGQYTGLTDKNGKRIFEGDIVRYGLLYDYECYLESLEHPEEYEGITYDADIEVDVVVWGNDYDYPAFDLKNHQFECNGLSQIACGDYEYEVIGNIHDNPELLEVNHNER